MIVTTRTHWHDSSGRRAIDNGSLKSLLQRVSSGAVSPDDAALLISADGASEDAAGQLDYATLDYDREARRGFPEVDL